MHLQDAVGAAPCESNPATEWIGPEAACEGCPSADSWGGDIHISVSPNPKLGVWLSCSSIRPRPWSWPRPRPAQTGLRRIAIVMINLLTIQKSKIILVKYRHMSHSTKKFLTNKKNLFNLLFNLLATSVLVSISLEKNYSTSISNLQ